MEKTASSPKRSLRYERLVDHFRRQVESRVLKPGDQLPSFAQMQAQHGIGQGTLEKVYSILESEHLVIRLPKRGTFVAEPRKKSVLNVIGVAPGIAPHHHDYYSQLLQGIQEVALSRGVEVLLLHENSLIRWEKMDGLILAGMPIRFPLGMPSVTLIRPVAGMPCVRIDEYGGARSATQHLIDLGHRRIGYLHTLEEPLVDPKVPGIAKLRLKGYRDALEEAGIKASRQWTMPEREPWEWVNRKGRDYVDIGYEKMNLWLDGSWAETGCTAILAHNDDMAIGIMRAVRERGLRVPEDLSIVGFDGSAVSRQVSPSLTTVVVPLREAGVRGMRSLLGQIDLSLEGAGTFRQEITEEVLATQLRVGESTAAPLVYHHA